VFTGDLDLCPGQERGDAPIAIGGPCAREALEGGLERRPVTALSLVIVATP
jgi:hypothetical protein